MHGSWVPERPASVHYRRTRRGQSELPSGVGKALSADAIMADSDQPNTVTQARAVTAGKADQKLSQLKVYRRQRLWYEPAATNGHHTRPSAISSTGRVEQVELA